MKLTFNNVHIVHAAIESLHYDAKTSELVLRTVSGAEHRKGMSAVVAEKAIENILADIKCGRAR